MLCTVCMLIFIAPDINKNVSPFLRSSRMALVYRLFTIRNEFFPSLSSRPKEMDSESKALSELITLYYPNLGLSENETEDEIEKLRYHSKRMLSSLHPGPSPSCLIQHHMFLFNKTVMNMYSIQHDRIDDWKLSDRPLVLYFHGGGFVFGGIDTYSGLECHLSKDLNMLVLHVDLRLAPEYLLDDTIDDVIGVYEVLLENSPNIHQRIIGMGDSSGGMLWLHLLQWLVLNKKPVPRAVVLHSPWPGLDFSNLNSEICTDRYINEGLIISLRHLAIGEDIEWFDLTYEQQKRFNPKAKSFYGFPPLYITAATKELFINEIRDMTKNMRLSNVDVILDEAEGYTHSYALFHLWSLKARCIQENIRRWIYEQLIIKRTSTWTIKMHSNDLC